MLGLYLICTIKSFVFALAKQKSRLISFLREYQFSHRIMYPSPARSCAPQPGFGTPSPHTVLPATLVCTFATQVYALMEEQVNCFYRSPQSKHIMQVMHPGKPGKSHVTKINVARDWRDGSVLKSTFCSRGREAPQVRFPAVTWHHMTISPVPGIYCPLASAGTSIRCSAWHGCRQNTSARSIKINTSIFFQERFNMPSIMRMSTKEKSLFCFILFYLGNRNKIIRKPELVIPTLTDEFYIPNFRSSVFEAF